MMRKRFLVATAVLLTAACSPNPPPPVPFTLDTMQSMGYHPARTGEHWIEWARVEEDGIVSIGTSDEKIGPSVRSVSFKPHKGDSTTVVEGKVVSWKSIGCVSVIVAPDDENVMKDLIAKEIDRVRSFVTRLNQRSDSTLTFIAPDRIVSEEFGPCNVRTKE